MLGVLQDRILICCERKKSLGTWQMLMRVAKKTGQATGLPLSLEVIFESRLSADLTDIPPEEYAQRVEMYGALLVEPKPETMCKLPLLHAWFADVASLNRQQHIIVYQVGPMHPTRSLQMGV